MAENVNQLDQLILADAGLAPEQKTQVAPVQAASGKKGNADWILDIAVPALAFVASAYSPQGAAAAKGLTSALDLGADRKERRAKAARVQELLGIRQQEADRKEAAAKLERPTQELAAAQSRFTLENLQGIQDIIGAPAPTTGAVQSLGEPQVARLQEALGRGEQAPLPMAAPTPQMRQQRFQDLAATPGGAAQLTAAGLGDVATSVTAEQREAAKAAAQARAKLTELKETVLGDLRGYAEEDLPPEQRRFLSQGILSAETPDDLLKVVADIPPGAVKPKSARIEEYKFYADHERQEGRQPLGPLAFDRARRKASATRIKTVTNVGPTGIDYGDPPKDTSWARNADGTVLLEPYGEEGQLAPVAIPVRGGQAYRDIQEGIGKKELAGEQAQRAAGIVVDTINRSLGTMDDSPLPVTGLIGSGLSNIPGTDAYNLRTQLDTVRANVGFETLQQMRQSSPTGGALGPVSDAENRLLQSVLGSLNQGQDKGEMTGNLNRIREIYLDVLHGVNRPNRQIEYLTQEDIATLNEAQAAQQPTDTPSINPEQLTPQDLSRLTPDQLDALKRQLSGGQQ